MRRDYPVKKDETEKSLKTDLLERNIYISNLLHILTTISKHTVLALDGNWGSGKTFFIKQFEHAANNPNNNYANISKENIRLFNNNYSIFYFNAWENDYLPPIEALLIRLSDAFLGAKRDWAEKVLKSAEGFIKNFSTRNY